MTVNPHNIRIKWYGHWVDWHQFNLTPGGDILPYAIVCSHEGDYLANEQLEIYDGTHLVFKSCDVWFLGAIKPY